LTGFDSCLLVFFGYSAPPRLFPLLPLKFSACVYKYRSSFVLSCRKLSFDSLGTCVLRVLPLTFSSPFSLGKAFLVYVSPPAVHAYPGKSGPPVSIFSFFLLFQPSSLIPAISMRGPFLPEQETKFPIDLRPFLVFRGTTKIIFLFFFSLLPPLLFLDPLCSTPLFGGPSARHIEGCVHGDC